MVATRTPARRFLRAGVAWFIARCAAAVWTPDDYTQLRTAVANCDDIDATDPECGTGSPMSAWNVGGITRMNNLFYNDVNFTGDITGWDVSSVTDMNGMFYGAERFNRDIGGLDVSSVTNMNSMFRNAKLFNQDIGGWDVSSVIDARSMFQYAKLFDRDIGGWDVSSVTKMNEMFFGAESFSHALDCWNDVAVTASSTMFDGATAFLAAFERTTSTDGPPSAWASRTSNTASCCGASAPSNGAMGTCRSALARDVGDSSCSDGSHVRRGIRVVGDSVVQRRSAHGHGGVRGDSVRRERARGVEARANAACGRTGGSLRAAGDDATGSDTACGCATNERVASNACVACASGETRAAGDDPTGSDTACAAALCAANERVSSNLRGVHGRITPRGWR